MIKGSIVALVTPMLGDGKVDYEQLDKLLQIHITSDTAAIVVGGTTGEASTLDVNEQSQLIKYVVNVCNNNIPVIAGIGANSTNEAIELAALAKASGAQSGLAVVPYYIRPNQKGITQHFESVARDTSFPQILYNIPSRTSVDMSDNTILTLAENKLIVGIKDATADISRAATLISQAPPHFACYSGDDSTSLAYMMLGGHGTISVLANVIPKAFSTLCSFIADENFSEARKLNSNMIPLYKALSVDTNPIPVKYVLSRLGLIMNKMRLPLSCLDEEKKLYIDSILSSSSEVFPEIHVHLNNTD